MYMPLFAESYDKHVMSMQIDDAAKTVVIYMDDSFGKQKFTEKSVRKIYKKVGKNVHKELPSKYKTYNVRVISNGKDIESLIENKRHIVENPDKKTKRKGYGWWGNITWDGAPWVTNTSLPH